MIIEVFRAAARLAARFQILPENQLAVLSLKGKAIVFCMYCGKRWEVSRYGKKGKRSFAVYHSDRCDRGAFADILTRLISFTAYSYAQSKPFHFPAVKDVLGSAYEWAPWEPYCRHDWEHMGETKEEHDTWQCLICRKWVDTKPVWCKCKNIVHYKPGETPVCEVCGQEVTVNGEADD